MNDYLGTATYSPEDNKLRLSCYARLSKEDYTRARAAGFIWAPKQELFVAPMWTPARENLLLEWCGEIGDEDKSLVERAEERADRFDDYSDKRRADADQAHKTVESICEHIPLGQPILVGHHSEKRARKDAERIENGMRRAVRMWEQADYWQQRAKGSIRHAKYKERPDVRARRIKGIEADKRKQERGKAGAESALRFWRGEFKLKNKETGESRPFEINEENREKILQFMGGVGAVSFPGLNVVPKEGGASWEGWDVWHVLQPEGNRYAACPSCTVAQCREAAFTAYPKLIAHYDRWINHYQNRLEYERAMLAADGGTVAERTGPEQGGACRCWASPGYGKGWSFIQKVNRVSVTLLDNWGNGGGNFSRTIPFDKLMEVMTKAAVDAARSEGRIAEAHQGVGFYLRPTGDDTPAPSGQENEIAHKEVLAAKEDNVCPDGASCHDPVCQDERRKIGIATETVQAMRETLKAGVRVVAAPQLFPTPPALAQKMVELAELQERNRILEPSAGTGNILQAIITADKGLPMAIEINDALAENLAKRFPLTPVIGKDFLTCNGELGKFDRILMNPPFENGSDIKHIKHALAFLNPGGRLVAICANGPRQQEQLKPLASEWIDLGPGAFEGTGVNTAIMVINRD